MEDLANGCTLPSEMNIDALTKFVMPQALHEARDIAEYVEGQASDEKVRHCESVKVEYVSGSRYDVWDVHTDKSRWWVITNPTNLYSQGEFVSLDYTLSFYIGLMARLAARSDREMDHETTDMMVVFRKIAQISDGFDQAEEVEDFQALGLQCREVLVALSRALAIDAVPASGDAPKVADFKGWSEAAADSMSPGSSANVTRSFLKQIARSSWDLVSWLTHSNNATHYDAVIALMATNACVDANAMMLRKYRSGTPDRCPACASYKITSLYRPEFETSSGYIKYCPKCDWTDTTKNYG